MFAPADFPPQSRAGRYWPLFVLPGLLVSLALLVRFLLLPLADRWAVGAPALEGLDQAEIPMEERIVGLPRELVSVLGTHPGRHAGNINVVAFSPDGKLLATGSDDPRVILWDLAELRPRAGLELPPYKGGQLLFAPDSKTLAIVGSHNIHLWNVAGEKPHEIAQLSDAGLVQSLAFAGNGKTLAWGGPDGNISVWDLDRPEPKRRWIFRDEEHPIRALALSGNGEHLGFCSGEQGDKVVIHSIKAGQLPREIHQVKAVGPTQTVVFTPDLKSLALVEDSGQVKVWSIDPDKVRASCEETGPWLALMADGQSLATCSTGGTVRRWSVGTDRAQLQTTLNVHAGDALEWATFSPDLKTVVIAGGGAVRVWDLAGPQAQLRGILQSKHRAALALAFSPDGKALAAGGWFTGGTGGESGGVQLWDLTGKQPRERARLGGHKKEVTAVAFAANGKVLASAGEDRTVRIWDITGSGRQRAVLEGHTGPLAFAPTSKMLATATGGSMYLWNLDGDKVAEWAKYPDPKNPPCRVVSLAFAPDGNQLATGTKGLTVDLWALGGPMPGDRIALDGHQTGMFLTYAADGKALLGIGHDGSVRQWDLQTTPPRMKGIVDALGSSQLIVGNPAGGEVLAALAPNGKLIASIVDDGRVVVWNVASGRRQHEWRLPGEVKALAFAPDSRHLATAIGNGTVYILRLATPTGAGTRTRTMTPQTPQ